MTSRAAPLCLVSWLAMSAAPPARAQESAAAAAQPDSLEQGAQALTEFKIEEARALLERARGEGPYDFDRYVRLWEQLGVASAYLDDRARALEAFDMVLTLEPGHVLSYTLSPKVTFLFEEARTGARGRQATTVDLSWPRDLRLQDPVPVDVEVVADPKGLLRRGELRYRRRGEAAYRARRFDMPAVSRYTQVALPPLDEAGEDAAVLQLYFVAFDEGANQVLLYGSPDLPREINLRYEPAPPWYTRWWIWAAVGGAGALLTGAAVGTAVFLATYQPSDSIDVVFQRSP